MKKLAPIVSLFVAITFSSGQVHSQESVLASGTLDNAFSSWGRASLRGDWEIVSVDGKTYIDLADNFKALDGPDVKIFLSPLSANDVKGNNATDGSLLVKLISEFEGAVRIELPAGTNLDDFESLVFHCEDYSKLWGVSPL